MNRQMKLRRSNLSLPPKRIVGWLRILDLPKDHHTEIECKQAFEVHDDSLTKEVNERLENGDV